MSENYKLLRAKDVGHVINANVGQVYRLTREGEFDDFLVKIGAKPSYRYRPDGLTEYLQRGGRTVPREER
jgi:hypothetical protein